MLNNDTYALPKSALRALSILLQQLPSNDASSGKNPTGKQATGITTDHVTQILARTLTGRDTAGLAMKALADVADKVSIGQYDNHKPTRILAEALNPYRTSIEVLQILVGTTESWLDGTSMPPATLEIVEVVFSSLVANDVTWEQWDDMTIHFTTVSLPVAKVWLSLRARGMELLYKALCHHSTAVRGHAPEWFHKIGASTGRSAENKELRTQHLLDQSQALAWLIDRLEEEDDLGVKVTLEHVLCELWAQQSPGEDKVAAALRTLERPLVHRLVSVSSPQSSEVSST
jgi:hypothetical protein